MFECFCCEETFEQKNIIKIHNKKNNSIFYICKNCTIFLKKIAWNKNNEYVNYQFCDTCHKKIYEVRSYEYGRLTYFGHCFENNNYSVGLCNECFQSIFNKL